MQLEFKKNTVKTPPNFVNSELITGSYYAIYVNGGNIPRGWVCNIKPGEWVAWNSYGDFWTSYGKTRDLAAAGMLSASWQNFVRNQR